MSTFSVVSSTVVLVTSSCLGNIHVALVMCLHHPVSVVCGIRYLHSGKHVHVVLVTHIFVVGSAGAHNLRRIKMFVSCEPHDGCCGRDLGKLECQDHPPTRLKHRLVSQNVLWKKAAPQMVASMGHFKLVGSYRPRRRLQYQKAVAESSSKSHRSRPP